MVVAPNITHTKTIAQNPDGCLIFMCHFRLALYVYTKVTSMQTPQFTILYNVYITFIIMRYISIHLLQMLVCILGIVAVCQSKISKPEQTSSLARVLTCKWFSEMKDPNALRRRL